MVGQLGLHEGDVPRELHREGRVALNLWGGGASCSPDGEGRC